MLSESRAENTTETTFDNSDMQCTQRNVLSLGLKNLRRSFQSSPIRSTGGGGGSFKTAAATNFIYQKPELPNFPWQGSGNFSIQHAAFSTAASASAATASSPQAQPLPKLPVPQLNDTLAKYLRYVNLLRQVIVVSL